MKPRNHSFDISRCITDTDPERESCLVIYPRGGAGTTPLVFLESYLRVARMIVTSCPPRGFEAGDDELAIPLLNVCVNAIEFALKVLIEELDAHRRSCEALRSPPGDYHRTLNKSHDLNKLVAVVETMLPPPGSLHEFPEFAGHAGFIRQLFRVGITSESTRYVTDPKGRMYSLYEQQLWVIPEELYEAVSAICGGVVRYATGDELFLCGQGEFNRKRLDELRGASRIMERKEALFRKYERPAVEEEVRAIKLFDAAALEEMKERTVGVRSAISDLAHEELAALTMGLYFTREPSKIETLAFFMGWDDERLRTKIIKRAHLLREALSALGMHMARIESKRRQRGR